MPQLRLGIVSGPPARIAECARALEWDCLRVDLAAQTAALAVLGGAAGLAGRRPRRRSSPIGPPRSQPSRRHPVSCAAVPSAAPFLFVRADSGEAVGDALARAGVPVVDGVHFQAPGYARLPFSGAARAEEALVAALARWATGARR